MNGKPAGRIGDAINCGGKAAQVRAMCSSVTERTVTLSAPSDQSLPDGAASC
ncbi:PAAR domain-containing protein [Rhodovulum sulfidophilum]|uniref:hypothetical protein n=1 Tax=Rhodovulum sulfidophilum TaxID=35806 RepID=UPI003872D8C9